MQLCKGVRFELVGSPTDLNRHSGADAHPGASSHSLRKPIHDFLASSYVFHNLQCSLTFMFIILVLRISKGPSLGGNEFFNLPTLVVYMWAGLAC